jgi:hypothetical protein
MSLAPASRFPCRQAETKGLILTLFSAATKTATWLQDRDCPGIASRRETRGEELIAHR